MFRGRTRGDRESSEASMLDVEREADLPERYADFMQVPK